LACQPPPLRDHERSEYSRSLRTSQKPAPTRWLFCVHDGRPSLLEPGGRGAKKGEPAAAGRLLACQPPPLRDHERSEYSRSLRTSQKPAPTRWLFCVHDGRPSLMKWSQDRGWVSKNSFQRNHIICSAIQTLTNIISIIQFEIFRVIRRIDSFRITQLQSLQYENSSNWCFRRHWPRNS